MGNQLLVVLPLVGLSVAGVFLLMRRRGGKGGRKDWRAFVERIELLPPPPRPFPAAPLPLSGLEFAVKDIFEIEGYTASFGVPAWKQSHLPAARTAPCVADLVAAGAKLSGTTHMDEMAYSIFGESCSDGTPVNPAAPQLVPGGSSSGSAVAVAAGLVDFALGTDTAGSVRVPAAFCSLLGYRPSHAAVSSAGCIPMAASLDTVGVFASDPAVLRVVAHILLKQPFLPPRPPLSLILADDLFDLPAPFIPRRHLTEPLVAAFERLFGLTVRYQNIGELLLSKVPSIKSFLPPSTAAAAAAGGDKGSASPNSTSANHNMRQQPSSKLALLALAEAMKALQRHEFRSAHAEWLSQEQPQLRPDIASRVKAALDAPQAALATAAAQAQAVREELRAALSDLLQNDALLALPASYSPPPRLRSKPAVLDDIRANTMLLVAPASMAGCPQVTLPVGRLGGKPSAPPFAVGLLSRHGTDRFLLDAVTHFAPALKEIYREMAPKIDQQRSDAASSSSSSRDGSNGGPAGDKAGGGAGSLSPADAAKEKGNAAYKARQFDSAVEHYSAAIRLNPRSATFYANRAMAYLQLGNFQQVEADCTSALNIDKKNVKALLRRGTAREMLGFYPEAYDDFQKALVLEPMNKTALESVQRMRENNIV